MDIIQPIIQQGDCLDYLTRVESNLFDLALIDPPYMPYKTGHRKDKASKLSQQILYQERNEQVRTIRECIRALKDNSAFFIFTNWENIWWIQQPFESFLRNMIIWDKGNWTAGDLEGSLANKYEVVFLGVKGKGWEYSGRRIPDIWEIPRIGTNRLHPTEKPVALYKKIIELSTQPGDMIFDPYVGSGSSAQAALETGRYFIGCEIDKDYYQISTRRINECLKKSV